MRFRRNGTVLWLYEFALLKRNAWFMRFFSRIQTHIIRCSFLWIATPESQQHVSSLKMKVPIIRAVLCVYLSGKGWRIRRRAERSFSASQPHSQIYTALGVLQAAANSGSKKILYPNLKIGNSYEYFPEIKI